MRVTCNRLVKKMILIKRKEGKISFYKYSESKQIIDIETETITPKHPKIEYVSESTSQNNNQKVINSIKRTKSPILTSPKLNIVSEQQKQEIVSKRNIIPKHNKLIIPEFSELIDFCEKFKENDIELFQFYEHAAPQLRNKRGGGGWVSSIKSTLSILRKMKKEGMI